MIRTLLNTLQQNQHDALVGLYLEEVIGKNAELKGKVTDENSLYEYLLIDPAITRKVTTTRIGEAIASLQQYIGRICHRLEPNISATADEIDEWQQWRHRYSLWAGLRQLESHPENYLDPVLRQHQTPQFAELQQEMQQGKLNENTIQKAVLNYLKNFETISTLKILSAFQAGDDFTTARFYFIGRTRLQPSEYYIRCLNLKETGGKAHKPSLNAWSHWQKIELNFAGAADTAIRPLYHEGRLYIAWFATPETRIKNPKGEGEDIVSVKTQLKMAQQMLDDSWRICVEEEFEDYKADFLAAGQFKDANGDHFFLSISDQSNYENGVELDTLLNAYKGRTGHKAHLRQYHGMDNKKWQYLVQRDIDLSAVPAAVFCGLVHEGKTESVVERSELSIRYMQTPVVEAEGKKRNYVLTTNLARTMIPYAQQGLEQLFTWKVQELTEPPLYGPPKETDPNTLSQPIDFFGAYGHHFWELFLHLPWLAANTYSEQQRFAESQIWHNRLFTPQRKDGRYFQNRPLHEVGQDSTRNQAPEDADAMATAHPRYYCKAVFFNYLRFLREYGDACYRELNRDGFNEAKQYYIQALNLLGNAPDRITAQRWVPITLDHLSKKSNDTLRTWEKSLATTSLSLLQLKDSAPAQQDTPFRIPQDAARRELWNSLQTRLYNLRHFLTLDGKPLSLPLYDSPVNPAELQRLLSSGQSLHSATGQQTLVVPPFRYPVMFERANRAVETLIQLGNSLLNTLERKDGLTLEQLQLTQQQDLLTYTLDMHQQAIDMGEHSLAALEKSKKSAKIRHDHYEELYKQEKIEEETSALSLYDKSYNLSKWSSYLFAGGIVGAVVPNVLGLAAGIPGAAAAAQSGGFTLGAVSQYQSTSAGISQFQASLKRSRQEWQLQYTLAEKEQEQIEKQIEVQKKQNEQYLKQKEQAIKQGEQIKGLLDFWSTRVTSAQLYQWLINQLRTLYRSAYDATFSLCMSTEAAWRCETGWFNDISALQNINGWQDSRNGLLSGESLKNALQKMDLKYLTRFERHQEVTHTFSLKALLGETQWNDVLKIEQKENLDINFNLGETLFAERYPNLYQRRIATISLTLPAVIGPYQNVCAQLTQSSSHILQDANTEAFTNMVEGKDHHAIRSNVRASQQVTLSTGFDDSGLFALNLADERYLPFEGNGVHSTWVLRFPNVQREEQKQLLKNLTDIIVNVRYRALDGGEAFANNILKVLTSPPTDSRVLNDRYS